MYVMEFNSIKKLFKTMDIPDYRKEKNTIENLKWLHKNLGARNKKHPNYNSAMMAITSVLEKYNY